jgi:hypothetical protein
LGPRALVVVRALELELGALELEQALGLEPIPPPLAAVVRVAVPEAEADVCETAGPPGKYASVRYALDLKSSSVLWMRERG